ncbi:hypothetical protein SAMN05421803_106221 [Nocardiopsis flavescens]|uniref:Uncharacterized protein n=2 Tax=Nocardiopsis flavescens TaxID=758803 RepID=A0A1M6JPZ8_9ACTN|nr:hypothetical protein SAMN05421803_106221 [Nocardiopsis flavescens]
MSRPNPNTPHPQGRGQFANNTAPYGSSEFGPLLPPPRADDPVGHGYTAFQVVRLAVRAARECRWVDAMDPVHRAETAWEAIVEHLQLAHERPEETELIAVGWKAMKAQHYQDLKVRGLGGKDKALLTRAFVRYWTSASAPAHSHEEQIVDRLALAQIWTALKPAHREVLTALAEHGDRRRAERSLNMDPVAFKRVLGRARRAFLSLWHEGETPSLLWGYDRSGARHQNVMYLVRLRKRRALQRKAEGHVRRYGHRPPRDLGVPDSELLARHEAGESYAALAESFGVSRGLIASRVAKTRARTPTGADGSGIGLPGPG